MHGAGVESPASCTAIKKWVVDAVAYFASRSDYYGMKSWPVNSDYGDALKALGAAVRSARVELSLSQEELAYRASIDRSHMGKIERGERNVSLVNIMKISCALGFAPSVLLGRAGL